MSNESSFSLSGALGAWALAAVVAAVAWVLLMTLGNWSFWGASFAAACLFAAAGLFLSIVLFAPLDGPKEPGTAGRTPGDIPMRHSGKPDSAAKAHPAHAAGKAVGAAAASAAKAADQTGAAVAEAADVAAETATDIADTATETTSAAAETVTVTVTEAAETVADAAETVTETAAAAVSGPGKQPARLEAARGGQADDLKKIKGVGPKLEKLCNSMGFYHFDQIANWSAEEIAWVDQNLEGFKGRVTRDDWVAQAKILAAGGETEFSKRS